MFASGVEGERGATVNRRVRRWRSPITTAWAVCAAVFVAACGSSSPSSASPPSASGTPTVKTATGNGIAQKTPAQIVAAAQAALRDVKGFVAVGALTQNGQPETLKIVDGGTSKLSMEISAGGRTAALIVLGSDGYMRANKAFWAAQGVGTASALLDNRWIKFPASVVRKFTSDLGPLTPKTLARCLSPNVGKLTLDGTTTVNGQPAVVIRDAGSGVGGSSGTLAVATTGTPYPLRITSNGKNSSSANSSACGGGTASGTQGVTKGTITLSHFNDLPPIAAPANAMTIPSSSGSAG